MPNYDYKCESCGYQFEVYHAIGVKGPSKCPECGARRVKRELFANGKSPALHIFYSPCHPRHGRGRGH